MVKIDLCAHLWLENDSSVHITEFHCQISQVALHRIQSDPYSDDKCVE